MIRYFSKHIANFIFLILFQVLILNNIQLSGYINPYLYILFIIVLPFETPKWILLITGFMLGLSIDLFSNTIGLHTFATVLIAFLRPYLLKYIAPREGYETGTQPNLNFFGTEWFIKYVIVLILVHHFALFYMEVFKFQQFFVTLLRVFLSSFFTFLLVLLSQYLTLRR
jgi:rod shape-determining protein MreD